MGARERFESAIAELRSTLATCDAVTLDRCRSYGNCRAHQEALVDEAVEAWRESCVEMSRSKTKALMGECRRNNHLVDRLADTERALNEADAEINALRLANRRLGESRDRWMEEAKRLGWEER